MQHRAGVAAKTTYVPNDPTPLPLTSSSPGGSSSSSVAKEPSSSSSEVVRPRAKVAVGGMGGHLTPSSSKRRRQQVRSSAHSTYNSKVNDRDLTPNEWFIFGSILGTFFCMMYWVFYISLAAAIEASQKRDEDLIRLNKMFLAPFLGSYGGGYRRVYSSSRGIWDPQRVKEWWDQVGGLGANANINVTDVTEDWLHEHVINTALYEEFRIIRVRCESLVEPRSIPWVQDLSPFENALAVAETHGMRVIPVLLTGSYIAEAAENRRPIDREAVTDNIVALIKAYARDPRVAAWDLIDDPSEEDLTIDQFIKSLFFNVRRIFNVSQPLTSTVSLHGPAGERWKIGELSLPRFTAMRRRQLEASDFVSFRTGGGRDALRLHVEFLDGEVARFSTCVGGSECLGVVHIPSSNGVGIFKNVGPEPLDGDDASGSSTRSSMDGPEGVSGGSPSLEEVDI